MSRFEAAPAVRLLRTEGGAVVIDLRTDAYYSLNRTGLEAWNVLSAGGTASQAADNLVGAFGVARDRALACVDRFVEEALSASLLTHRQDG